ncbi:trafficking protein particle complex subunit 3 [Phtheirospermum japonicum]|uniref:16S rRNA (uracil(1498)-N(3))-methyltransferase n=1 Tax=Phtheirospermum japonicum TaxID=374723 RepID=A0A830CJL4_9LAMI|nr:trafficking protein particle complex subunit 3 [Phtheirospermum japonicum]
MQSASSTRITMLLFEMEWLDLLPYTATPPKPKCPREKLTVPSSPDTHYYKTVISLQTPHLLRIITIATTNTELAQKKALENRRNNAKGWANTFTEDLSEAIGKKSNLLYKAFSILEQMKSLSFCQPDVYTYNILIKASVDARRFELVGSLYDQMVGFKMVLGVTASVTNWDLEGTTCSLVLEDNPLVDFVELPDTCQGLHYCYILSGIVRGNLEMFHHRATRTSHAVVFLTSSLKPYPLHKGGVVLVEGDEFWHMNRVLRLGINDRRIEKIDRAGADFEALDNPKLVSPQTTQWHVFAAFNFTEKELNSLKDAGVIGVGLGPHRLHVETATMSLFSTLMLWSDSHETVGSQLLHFQASPFCS